MIRTVIRILLIVITGVIIYSNSLNNAFIFDDNIFIRDNPRIRDLSNFTDIAGTRYLTFLSLAVNYHVNGFDVAGYHIVNIALHVINAVLVCIFISLIFKTPLLGASPIARHSGSLALFSGLLFVSHPVYIHAVTYIFQRGVLLTTFFYLLSIVLFIKARLNYKKFFSKEHLPYYLLSLASAVLAMKCKEIAFTLPVVIVLFDRFFFRKVWSFKKALPYLIPFLLTLLIIPLDRPQTDVFASEDPRLFKVNGNRMVSALGAKLSNIPRIVYISTEFKVVLTYVRLFFFPVNLSYSHYYSASQSLLSTDALLSFFILLSVLALSVYLFWRSRNAGGSGLLISFGVLWFFTTISLESFVFVLGSVIFEYRLYLPSVGIIIALAGITGHAMVYLRDRVGYLLVAAAVVVAAFSSLTYTRNPAVKDEITIWENNARKYSRYWEAYATLGKAYFEHGLLDKAIQTYKTALSINPDLPKIHLKLGLVYYNQGRTREAVQEYRIALKLNPGNAETYNNLADAYMAMGAVDEAIKYYKAALNKKRISKIEYLL